MYNGLTNIHFANRDLLKAFPHDDGDESRQ